MHYLADHFEDFNPFQQQLMGKKLQPIIDNLKKLPGGENFLRTYIRKSTGDLAAIQPEA